MSKNPEVDPRKSIMDFSHSFLENGILNLQEAEGKAGKFVFFFPFNKEIWRLKPNEPPLSGSLP